MDVHDAGSQVDEKDVHMYVTWDGRQVNLLDRFGVVVHTKEWPSKGAGPQAAWERAKYRTRDEGDRP